MKPDVAVIGAGPAGMAAAIRASAGGAQVLILDDNPSAGGQIWRGMEESPDDRQAREWFHKFASLQASVLNNCRVISASTHPLTLLAETPTDRLEVSPHSLILATGARELFLPFPGWTLPGVMGAGGLQAMAKSGLPIAGKRIVVGGSGPLLLAVSAYLRSHGAHVKLIAEHASQAAIARFGLHLTKQPAKFAQAVVLQFGLRGVPYLHGCWVEEALGDGRLQSVRIRHGRKTWTEDCDYAAIAYGLYPNAELALLLGCRMSGAYVAVDELQRTSIDNVYCAGESTGIGGVDLSLVEGEIAGYAATRNAEHARALSNKRKRAQAFAEALDRAFALRPELRSLPREDTFVCRCEDVSFERLQQVTGFRAAKLHTRCGMGPCQARLCGPATEFLFGWRNDSVRPPLYPARMGTLIENKTEQQETLT
jgi:NADPH-dependent 2,4-dienoyl-CoA reductase/sulfur reductase-like enzyme